MQVVCECFLHWVGSGRGSCVFMLHDALDIVRSLPLLGYIKCMN